MKSIRSIAVGAAVGVRVGFECTVGLAVGSAVGSSVGVLNKWTSFDRRFSKSILRATTASKKATTMVRNFIVERVK